jgi:hypothetical protein
MNDKETIERLLKEERLRDEQDLVKRDIKNHRTLEKETKAKKRELQQLVRGFYQGALI